MEKDMADDIMEEEFEDTAEDIVADKINREAEELLKKAQEDVVEEQAEAENQDKPEEKIKKSFGKKKEKKDKKDEKIEELTDQVKRQMAEFDNFRKRTEKEKSTMYEVGAKSVVEKILPVVDNFERGLQTIPEEDAGTPFAEGMQMIYKQLMTSLEQIGVTPIEAVGEEFNPELHNAVMQVESDEFESGVVAQELQKGYKYRDSVVRHSMVGVVQ
ncbi:MAG TPA: nucleotide exchange factor GrpE [Lachnospiraceae bacterium]|nr:nucleotide exchange factor GrpE [Lachnospiraceae bacterium]